MNIGEALISERWGMVEDKRMHRNARDVRATFSLQRRAGADLRGKGRVKIERAAVENIWVQIVRFRNLRQVLLLLHHLHKKGSESAQSKRGTRFDVPRTSANRLAPQQCKPFSCGRARSSQRVRLRKVLSSIAGREGEGPLRESRTSQELNGLEDPRAWPA